MCGCCQHGITAEAFRSLSACRKLRHVVMRACMPAYTSLEPFRYLASSHSLKCLDLSDCYLATTATMEAMLRHLATSSSLKHVRVNNFSPLRWSLAEQAALRELLTQASGGRISLTTIKPHVLDHGTAW